MPRASCSNRTRATTSWCPLPFSNRARLDGSASKRRCRLMIGETREAISQPREQRGAPDGGDPDSGFPPSNAPVRRGVSTRAWTGRPASGRSVRSGARSARRSQRDRQDLRRRWEQQRDRQGRFQRGWLCRSRGRRSWRGHTERRLQLRRGERDLWIGGRPTTSTTVVPAVPAPQFWSQNATGVPGISEAGDAFGSALAAGDFNGDGYSDLAVGIPGDDVDFTDSGAVIVIYGSRNGLTATDPGVPAARFLDLRSATSPYGDLRFLRAGARLGSSLTWGDFNGDGVGDLAMGAPRADVGVSCYPYVCDVADEAGLVWVLSGRTHSGLDLVSNSVCFGFVEYVGFDVRLLSGNQFGKVLTSGDFDRDGFFDLVVGAPSSAGLLGVGRNAGRNGRVTVIFASSVGASCDGVPRPDRGSRRW